jgi:hypothetical protein
MRRLLLAAAVASTAIPSAEPLQTDYAVVALDVLPPGQTAPGTATSGVTSPQRKGLSFGFLPVTARWTNRPTFQQVITFTGHRPR